MSPNENSSAHRRPSPRRRVDSGKAIALLPSQPIHVPIPPSLIQSPHLNSPQSIFRRASSTPCPPSQEDEDWLRDTVPLLDGGRRQQHEQQQQQHREKTAGTATTAIKPPTTQVAPIGPPAQSPPIITVAKDNTMSPRGRSTQPRIISGVPPSPPLVRWRRSASPDKHWPAQTKDMSRSEPSIMHVAQNYFAA
jgi:hypothetical protein